MYWADSCYKTIDCNDSRKGILKLPMDQEKMKNFRKIMWIDTITERSIGKVYYIRIHGGIEFYTSGGNHPIEVTHNLQKLTPYMFKQHLKKNAEPID
jgi:hypothetical protein